MAQSSHRGFVEAAASSSSGPCANLFTDGVDVAVDGINVAVNDVDSAPPAPAAPIDFGQIETMRTKKTLPTSAATQANFISEVIQVDATEPPPLETHESPPKEVSSTVKPSATRRRSPTLRIPSPAVSHRHESVLGLYQGMNLFSFTQGYGG